MRQAGAALLAVVLALGLASCGEPTRVEAGEGGAPLTVPSEVTQLAGQTATTSRSSLAELECTPNEKYLWGHTADILEAGIDRSNPDGASPENAIRAFLERNDKLKSHRLGDEVPADGIKEEQKPNRGFYKRPSEDPARAKYGYARGNRTQLILTVESFDGYWITTGASACNEGITE